MKLSTKLVFLRMAKGFDMLVGPAPDRMPSRNAGLTRNLPEVNDENRNGGQPEDMLQPVAQIRAKNNVGPMLTGKPRRPL